MTYIKIFDTTLRDGEQSPGVALNTREKTEIARQLARLGVDIIEAGFPIASEGDFQAVREIARTIDQESEKVVVAGLARAGKGDVERAAQALEGAKNPRIHTFIATSSIHMEKKLQLSPEAVIERAVEAVSLAKRYVDDVEFSAEDAGRSDPERVFDKHLSRGDRGRSHHHQHSRYGGLYDAVGIRGTRRYDPPAGTRHRERRHQYTLSRRSRLRGHQ
jgi:2-isopropylmalate synthase